MKTHQHSNLKTRLSILAVITTGVALFCPQSEAQISFTGGTITQNFDTLASTGTTTPFADNSTIPGLYADQLGASSTTLVGGTNGKGNVMTPAAYLIDNGSNNSGSLYSYGSTGSTERALGSVSSGTPGAFEYGFVFTNNTFVTLTKFSVNYTGEEWRQGGNTSAQTLAFNYLIDNAGAAFSDATFTGTNFTADTNLNFVSPTLAASGTTGAALDGNATANRAMLSDTIDGLSIAPGATIYLRFTDINDTGNDHGLAVDDFNFTAVPEPTTVLGGALALGAFGWSQRRRFSVLRRVGRA